jgi:Leu/Phe-tRNA-protein transferase
MDRLAVTWSVGIAIGYAFLISLTCWIAYRVFLVYNAFHAADYAFVVSEVKNDLLICAGYFGVAGVLRYAGHI